MLLDHVDEDTQGRLAGTNRYWAATAEPHLHPAGISAHTAVMQGRRHALARLWACDDSSASSVGITQRDTDGMTPLMHASTTGNAPMLRCLLRHSGRRIDQTDHFGLTAVSWASLTGHRQAFTNAVLGSPRWVGPDRRTRIDPHDAIAVGHWRLTQALLEPHYIYLMFAAPACERPGYRLHKPLSCTLLPHQCIEAHAPPDAGPSGMRASFGRYIDGAIAEATRGA